MQPNIILITIDCWRFDRLSVQTKNIKNVAQKGVLFQQAYTGGGWTQAAFPALLSSTYGSMYNGCLGPLSEERTYLPEWLNKQGYKTLVVQTSPLLNQNFGYERGVDEFESLQPPWQAPSWYEIKGMQRLLQQSGFHRLASVAKLESRPAPAYANAKAATDKAIALLRQTDEPFFLWVHYMDAHWPYFDQEGHDSPAELAQSWTDRRDGHLAMRQKNRHRPPTRTLKRWVKMHDAAIESIDKQVGRLLDAVEQKVGDDVLTIITGDHGEEFYEHGNFGHGAGSLYEEIVHVPLIIACQNLFSPRTIEQTVSLLEIAPTITDLLEDIVPERMVGGSLLPLLTGEGLDEVEPRSIIVDSHWADSAHVVAIRVKDFKFIINLATPDIWQLYDLRSDPEENNNLRTNVPDKAPDFWPLLDRFLATVQASEIASAETPEADTDLLLRLRDLGYVD